MEDLLTCPWKTFVEKIGEITDTKELQNVLWQLEDEYLKVTRNKRITKNFTFSDVKGIDESKTKDQKLIMESRLKKRLAKKAFEEFPNEMLLKRKVQFCRETLLMLKNKSREKVAESISKLELRNFSYGIEQLPEPEKLFVARCQYRKSNRIARGNMTASHCGDLKWYNEAGLNIDQIKMLFRETRLNVPMDEIGSNEVRIDSKDIQAALAEEEKRRGELELVKVQIDDDNIKEQSIEYFILMSRNKNLNWEDPEVQTFFVQTYLSNTYRNLAAKATKSGECLYGGRIVKNPDGKMEVRFYKDEMVGLEKACNNIGTTRTPEGRGKRQSLKGMIEGIQSDLAAKALRKAFEQPGEEGDR